MKKTIVLLLLIFVFTLTSCQNKKTDENEVVVPTGSFTEGTISYLTYKYYVPESYDGSSEVPLFVMLHGASQNADSFANITKMNLLADQKNFIVLYPQQSSSANVGLAWNWFYVSNQKRDSGEPALIAQMIEFIKDEYLIDDDNVFVAGLSAGGATAVIMAITYPDLIKGVAIAAGLEYKAATSVFGAIDAVGAGGPDPILQGRLAYENMIEEFRHLVPTLVFHGTEDSTVDQINAHQILTQFAVLNDLVDDGIENGSVSDSPNQIATLKVSDGYSYTRSQYFDSNKNVLMEKYIISGMSHAWSGGKSGPMYSDPKGPDMTLIMYEFFINQ